MSKKIQATAVCPSCSQQYAVTLYRSIWIEYPELRDLVFTDKVNMVTCPGCGHTDRAPMSLLATNSRQGFAVWYEPAPDPHIDADARMYAMMGGMSFLATAPRIRSWDDFKATILRLEQGSAPETRSPSAWPTTPDALPTYEDIVRNINAALHARMAKSRAMATPANTLNAARQGASNSPSMSPSQEKLAALFGLAIGLLVFFVIHMMRR